MVGTSGLSIRAVLSRPGPDISGVNLRIPERSFADPRRKPLRGRAVRPRRAPHAWLDGAHQAELIKPSVDNDKQMKVVCKVCIWRAERRVRRRQLVYFVQGIHFGGLWFPFRALVVQLVV